MNMDDVARRLRSYGFPAVRPDAIWPLNPGRPELGVVINPFRLKRLREPVEIPAADFLTGALFWSAYPFVEKFRVCAGPNGPEAKQMYTPREDFRGNPYWSWVTDPALEAVLHAFYHVWKGIHMGSL